MVNHRFELDRLRNTLISRGMSDAMVMSILLQAENKINEVLREQAEDAMSKAIEYGIDKRSGEFINELVIRPNDSMFTVETESGNTDFSDPPFPMLPRLLSGAKPIKDGSGVYKVIPVGSGEGRSFTTIMDAQKAIALQRNQEAAERYAQITSNVGKRSGQKQFRTATSKQNADTQWVLPATEKDFTSDLKQLNEQLRETSEDSILEIIREYEDKYT